MSRGYPRGPSGTTAVRPRAAARVLLVSVLALGLMASDPALARAAVPDPADDPARVTLSTLLPRTSGASRDLPRVYRDGCHVGFEVTSPVHCIYGKRDGARVVVVIGDSIMAQWWAAIDGAARQAGWRLVWMTKTACPGGDVSVRWGTSRYVACDTWRRNVLRKIRVLPRVDLLVIGGSSRSVLLRRGTWTALTNASQKRAEWQAGLERTVQGVAGEARRVVILRDTPGFAIDIPACLTRHGGWTRDCSASRSAALSALHWQAEQAVDARHSWVRATDMADWLCQPTRCWPVTSGRILRYRDKHHMTNTYAATLAPAMYSRLRWLMR